MEEPMPGALGDLQAEQVASVLYSGAVFILATGPEPLWERLYRAYDVQANQASGLVDRLPPHIAKQINDLQDELGQSGGEPSQLDRDALWLALDGMDDTALHATAESICFITADLVNACAGVGSVRRSLTRTGQ
jgi:hypothetical protein